jgi:hypothetical protein
LGEQTGISGRDQIGYFKATSFSSSLRFWVVVQFEFLCELCGSPLRSLRLKALASAPSSLDFLNAEEDQDRGTFETAPLSVFGNDSVRKFLARSKASGRQRISAS